MLGRRLAVAVILLALSAGGCNIIGWVGHAVPDKVPAVYKLPKRPTLILVDDPQRQLRDPALASVVLSRVAFDLTENKVVKKVVPVVEVNKVAAKEGANFELMSAGSLAKQLDADQVIQVQVERVELEPSPGLVQPTALVYVKVVDADGKRLFPAGDAGGAAPSPRGYPLTVKLPQAAPNVQAQQHAPALLRALASRTGTRVAQLFYQHSVPRTSEQE